MLLSTVKTISLAWRRTIPVGLADEQDVQLGRAHDDGDGVRLLLVDVVAGIGGVRDAGDEQELLVRRELRIGRRDVELNRRGT